MYFIKEKVANIYAQDIFNITFTNDHNYSISFFNYGGCFHSIRIPNTINPNETEDVLLGYDKFENYFLDNSYLNCIIGRVCGRIPNSQFYLNNKKYILYSNDGKNHLHGGQLGFNKKIWKINKLEKNSDEIKCSLYYKSENLEENYPGNLDCIVDYIFNNNNELLIKFKARSDENTFVNLTNHNYWNFHGHNTFYQNVVDHKIRILADSYCETNKNLIATGRLVKSLNTKYDLNNYKSINKDFLIKGGADICYYIRSYDKSLRKVASVYSKKTKMGMELFSDQPGLQFYTGNMMEQSYQGKHQKNYGPQYAFCLEPQLLPHAINQESFKIPVLKANENYISTISMKFRNDF